MSLSNFQIFLRTLCPSLLIHHGALSGTVGRLFSIRFLFANPSRELLCPNPASKTDLLPQLLQESLLPSLSHLLTMAVHQMRLRTVLGGMRFRLGHLCSVCSHSHLPTHTDDKQGSLPEFVLCIVIVLVAREGSWRTLTLTSGYSGSHSFAFSDSELDPVTTNEGGDCGDAMRRIVWMGYLMRD